MVAQAGGKTPRLRLAVRFSNGLPPLCSLCIPTGLRPRRHAIKPLRLEATYVIRAPPEAVYDLITDFENAPRNFPSVAKAVRILKRDGNHLEAAAETKAFLGSRTFKVHMDAHLRPKQGFSSTNTSSLGIEREVMTLQSIPEGTRIVYVNDVEITSRFFRLFGGFLIKTVALKYWQRAVLRRMKMMLEH